MLAISVRMHLFIAPETHLSCLQGLHALLLRKSLIHVLDRETK